MAVKVIDKLLVRHARLENKIQQEMVLHAQLQHPNIVRVHVRGAAQYCTSECDTCKGLTACVRLNAVHA